MFPTGRFYKAMTCAILLMASGFFWEPLLQAGQITLALIILLTVIEISLLYYKRHPASAERYCAPRFSNGDSNEVMIVIENRYPFEIQLEIIDEIPVIFQRRDILFKLKIKPSGREMLRYCLRPVKRGVYDFGNTLLYITIRTGLISRRIKTAEKMDIAVYPSYIMLQKYEFLAIHNNLTEVGIKKMRRIGHNTEFESIREYVKGDDYRTINWKASARRHFPMCNVWQDERSQQIYSIIDKGRIMQSAFRGMTLLDYAINASLVLSYIAIHKDDKAGLVTFAENLETFIPADKHDGQMKRILESLYRQQTTFGESDYASLCVHINNNVRKRSLLIIYTNFDSLNSMSRQIACLRQLSKRHVVLVVFFEDAEMKRLVMQPPATVEGYYEQVISDKFISDKQSVAIGLSRYGVSTLLTEPENLSVDLINKYLEMKARGVI